MKATVRNMDYLRGKDPLLHQTLSDVLQKVNNLAAQGNFDPNASSSTVPGNIAALSVTASSGLYTILITDNSNPAPGVHYIVEYSTATNFSPLYQEDLGQSKSVRRYLGTGITYYFRAYSLYQQGNASAVVYFGTQQTPTGVTG